MGKKAKQGRFCLPSLPFPRLLPDALSNRVFNGQDGVSSLGPVWLICSVFSGFDVFSAF